MEHSTISEALIGGVVCGNSSRIYLAIIQTLET